MPRESNIAPDGRAWTKPCSRRPVTSEQRHQMAQRVLALRVAPA